MIDTLAFKQLSDLNSALTPSGDLQLSGEKLLGRWVNTNRQTQGIAECIITQDGEHVNLRIMGVGTGAPVEWPSVRARILANLEEEAGQRTVALAADFEFDFMKIETHLRVNRGVLVIVIFNTFTDGSGRSNYLNREFFYRMD